MELEKWQADKFESIKHIDENGDEFWLARELQSVLDYAQWRRFCDVIDRAMVSCKLNEQEPKFHFAETTKTTEIGGRTKKDQYELEFAGVGNFYDEQEKLEFANTGKTRKREISDYKLTRFACYLIVMNGDPRKEPIAHGQMYFAVKTRQQEVQELYNRLDEDGKRLFLRLDYMGSVELAANLFRITQTEDALAKSGIKDKKVAGDIHYNIGKEVRGAIERIGGTMPEDLPTPEKSIPQLQKEQIKKIK